MLMSIFSSIDAFCAESMRRKLPITTSKHSSPTETPKTEEDHRSNQLPSSSSSVKKPPEREIGPRFAPEFDGVNCFETIVPY
ncbi:hypothetical protein SSX86_016995 [Deinandra increscens subsp. villosa]|uniref:Uncharacterized protein n=1 Tax=Deinandra increscens subsp. villosa TaxID=3103831 RepID=A0AAP0CZ24_9ASTR